MAIVKGKCLKCENIIDVDDSEDAGLCPECGAPFVTEKVVKNYAAANTSAAKEKPQTAPALFPGFDALEKKYNAFVALYKIDDSALMDLFRLRVRIREKEAELNLTIGEHNKLVKSSEKWVDRYNSRVEGFNNAKYTAGADSLSEKLHRKYVESAAKKHGDIGDDIKYAQKKVEKERQQIDELVQKESELADKIDAECFEYSARAREIVEIMYAEYPDNPLTYLYAADYYRREVEWRKKFADFAASIYEDDSLFMTLVYEDFKIDEIERKHKSELEKAEVFMTPELRTLYADKIKKLKGKKSGSSSSSGSRSGSSTRSSSAGSKSKSTTTRSYTAKTSSAEAAAKSKKREERSIKRHMFLSKVVSTIIGIGVLVAVGFFVLKCGFKVI